MDKTKILSNFLMLFLMVKFNLLKQKMSDDHLSNLTISSSIFDGTTVGS